MIWKRIFNDAVNGHGAGTVDPIPSSSVSEEPQEVRPLCVEGKLPDRPVAMDSCVSAEIVLRMTIESEDQIGRTALLLAATTSSEKETELKKDLASLGWRAVATEVGGLIGELPAKITRALVGASLNASVVEKKQNEMHALMHAAHEALEGFLPLGLLEASVGTKIAIVRNSKWISVAIMGDTAYHAVAHHERCGLGVMHL